MSTQKLAKLVCELCTKVEVETLGKVFVANLTYRALLELDSLFGGSSIALTILGMATIFKKISDCNETTELSI